MKMKIKNFNKFKESMNKKILICEKNKSLGIMMKAKLEISGYKVLLVNDGKAAIDIIENDNTLDMIISELLIPFVTGLEIINYVRNKIKSKIPILIISNNTEQSKIEAFNLGADEYMSKPISLKELEVRIDKLLN